MFDSTARDTLLQKIAAIEKQAYAPPMPMPPDAATSMVPPPPPPQDPAMMAPPGMPPMPPGAMPPPGMPPMDPSMGGVDPATGQPMMATPPPPMDPSQMPPMITMSAEDLTQAFEMIASKLGEAKPEGKSEGGKLSEIETRLKNLETLLSQALGPVAAQAPAMPKQAFEERMRASAEARAAAEKPAQLELLQALRRQRGV